MIEHDAVRRNTATATMHSTRDCGSEEVRRSSLAAHRRSSSVLAPGRYRHFVQRALHRRCTGAVTRSYSVSVLKPYVGARLTCPRSTFIHV